MVNWCYAYDQAIYVMFFQETMNKMRIRKVSCVGAGLIGHSWATLFAWKGYQVALQDLNEETLEHASSGIRRNLEFLAETGLLNAESCEKCLEKVKLTTDLSGAVGDADYVQESVYESYKAKKEVFRSMDAAAKTDAVLASSSSTLKMTVIQKATRKPERCIVAHPWNPPHLMPLVEIVPGKRTSPEVTEATKEFMTHLGKVPVVQKKEVSGTIGNRLAAAVWREAIDLVYRGVAELEDVDKAVSAGPGIRWAILGPHLSYHLAGGSEGIEYFLKHLGPAMAARWRTLATWTSIPSAAERKIVEAIGKTKMVQEKRVEDIAKWRDNKLVAVLKILYGGSDC